MNKKELKTMKEDMKAKAKALSDAHKGKPPKANTKAIKASPPKHKPQSTDVITDMIARIVGTLDGNIDRLVGDMGVDGALDVIERLQELRDTENYHSLKWG